MKHKPSSSQNPVQDKGAGPCEAGNRLLSTDRMGGRGGCGVERESWDLGRERGFLMDSSGHEPLKLTCYVSINLKSGHVTSSPLT